MSKDRQFEIAKGLYSAMDGDITGQDAFTLANVVLDLEKRSEIIFIGREFLCYSSHHTFLHTKAFIRWHGRFDPVPMDCIWFHS